MHRKYKKGGSDKQGIFRYRERPTGPFGLAPAGALPIMCDYRKESGCSKMAWRVRPKRSKLITCPTFLIESFSIWKRLVFSHRLACERALNSQFSFLRKR